MAAINSPADFAEVLKAGPFAFPGGYAIVFSTSDGYMVHWKCVNRRRAQFRDAIKRKDSERVTSAGIYWEGPPEECAVCGKPVVSEYGDPDDE